MKLTLRTFYGPLALALVGLTSAARADFAVGQRVPSPTAANQYPVSTPYTGGFVWTPVTLPWLSNGSQTAFGGAIDTTSRVSVNPQGAGENGLTVNMPASSTGASVVVSGYGTGVPLSLVLRNNSGSVGTGIGIGFQSENSATPLDVKNAVVFQRTSPNYSVGDFVFLANTANSNTPATMSDEVVRITSSGRLLSKSYTMGSDLGLFPVAGGNSSVQTYWPLQLCGNTQTTPSNYTPTNFGTTLAHVIIPLTQTGTPGLAIKGASGQTADLLDITDSTNAVKASVNKNFVVTAKGYASSVRFVTAADTATLTDSVLLCNGTFTETLPATGWPTGYRLTVKSTGTGTVTLTAGGTVTFDGATTMTFATQYKSRVLVFDGTNFQVESGLL